MTKKEPTQKQIFAFWKKTFRDKPVADQLLPRKLDFVYEDGKKNFNTNKVIDIVTKQELGPVYTILKPQQKLRAAFIFCKPSDENSKKAYENEIIALAAKLEDLFKPFVLCFTYYEVNDIDLITNNNNDLADDFDFLISCFGILIGTIISVKETNSSEEYLAHASCLYNYTYFHLHSFAPTYLYIDWLKKDTIYFPLMPIKKFKMSQKDNEKNEPTAEENTEDLNNNSAKETPQEAVGYAYIEVPILNLNHQYLNKGHKSLPNAWGASSKGWIEYEGPVLSLKPANIVRECYPFVGKIMESLLRKFYEYIELIFKKVIGCYPLTTQNNKYKVLYKAQCICDVARLGEGTIGKKFKDLIATDSNKYKSLQEKIKNTEGNDGEKKLFDNEVIIDLENLSMDILCGCVDQCFIKNLNLRSFINEIQGNIIINEKKGITPIFLPMIKEIDPGVNKLEEGNNLYYAPATELLTIEEPKREKTDLVMHKIDNEKYTLVNSKTGDSVLIKELKEIDNVQEAFKVEIDNDELEKFKEQVIIANDKYIQVNVNNTIIFSNCTFTGLNQEKEEKPENRSVKRINPIELINSKTNNISKTNFEAGQEAMDSMGDLPYETDEESGSNNRSEAAYSDFNIQSDIDYDETFMENINLLRVGEYKTNDTLQTIKIILENTAMFRNKPKLLELLIVALKTHTSIHWARFINESGHTRNIIIVSPDYILHYPKNGNKYNLYTKPIDLIHYLQETFTTLYYAIFQHLEYKVDENILKTYLGPIKTLARSAKALTNIFQAFCKLRKNPKQAYIFDSVPNILPFNDRVVEITDTQRLKIRKFNPNTDFFTNAFDFNYNTYRNDKFITSYFTSLINNAEERNYLIYLLANTLIGTGVRDRMLFFVGNGKNGKSLFLRNLVEIFGSFGIAVQHDFFSKNLLIVNKPSTALLAIQNKKICVIGEHDAALKMKTQLVKTLTGVDDTITTRDLYANEQVQFRPNSLFMTASNHIPQFDINDEALHTRYLIFDFENKFVETPNNTNVFEKPLDHSYRDKFMLPEYKIYFINYLIAFYRHKGKLNIPKSLLIKNENIFTQSKIIENWLNDNVEWEIGSVIKTTEFADKYYSGNPPPISTNEYRNFMDKLDEWCIKKTQHIKTTILNPLMEQNKPSEELDVLIRQNIIIPKRPKIEFDDYVIRQAWSRKLTGVSTRVITNVKWSI